MADFEIGDVVKGKKFGPMDHDFTGVVEKVYNNSIMVSIQDFDPADKSGVNELNGRAVIRQKEAKMIKAVPREEKDADEDEDSKKSPAKKTRTTKAKTTKKKTQKKSTKKADK
ncbi:hypothetical protein [Limosilactobacillus sp.]|uniref:hypothetical protein n=1 Tax=Limosilactobacillus sp. TaxID=2773925 RepID=UPI0025BFC3E8|nr:hypothetical protein [Limosilactobacillus sp.]MCH3923130.1 hypothetical protein [Limosilactobacillus sp.]MCH3927813.1 hypothetical protein [Limosilactobacillus sp.]